METNPRIVDDLFLPLTRALAGSLAESAPESPQDPRLDGLVSSKAMALQFSTADHLFELSKNNPENLSASGKLIRLLGIMERTQSRVMRKAKPDADDDRIFTIQREEAHAFLQAELAENQKPAADLIASAAKIGIARRTLMRAKSDLNITSHVALREDKSRAWMWKYTPASSSVSSNTPADTRVSA